MHSGRGLYDSPRPLQPGSAAGANYQLAAADWTDIEKGGLLRRGGGGASPAYFQSPISSQAAQWTGFESSALDPVSWMRSTCACRSASSFVLPAFKYP